MIQVQRVPVEAAMNDTTFDLIQKLAEERSQLYRLAAHQHLRAEQLSRVHEIEGRLNTLWDTHRRELASSRRPISYSEAQRRVA